MSLVRIAHSFEYCWRSFRLVGFCSLVSLSLYSSTSAMAHGTAGTVVSKRTTCVLFSYDDGEAMSYAKVTVNEPDVELPFQSGATDKNGIACFAPDRFGQWQINANDGMGHMQKLAVPVVEEHVASSTISVSSQPATPSQNRPNQILGGLGIIFGLTGIISMIQSCRKEKKLRQQYSG